MICVLDFLSGLGEGLVSGVEAIGRGLLDALFGWLEDDDG